MAQRHVEEWSDILDSMQADAAVGACEDGEDPEVATRAEERERIKKAVELDLKTWSGGVDSTFIWRNTKCPHFMLWAILTRPGLDLADTFHWICYLAIDTVRLTLTPTQRGKKGAKHAVVHNITSNLELRLNFGINPKTDGEKVRLSSLNLQVLINKYENVGVFYPDQIKVLRSLIALVDNYSGQEGFIESLEDPTIALNADGSVDNEGIRNVFEELASEIVNIFDLVPTEDSICDKIREHFPWVPTKVEEQ